MANKIREVLRNKLSEELISLLPSSYDIVGDIMLFSDFPLELLPYQKIICDNIFTIFRNIRVVVRKTCKYSGRYRLPKLNILSGENRFTTDFKENNCRFKIDISRCYFSPRLSEERKRIAKFVSQDECVLVMFSGIGVYPIVIAKNSPAREIYGIELNKHAHKYAEMNVKINKINNINLFHGDVKKILPKIKMRFNRIVMPLPKGADNYLELALGKIKRYGVIHYYDFEREDKFEKIINKIETKCKLAKKGLKLSNIIKCGQYSPRVFRVCIDFKVY